MFNKIYYTLTYLATTTVTIKFFITLRTILIGKKPSNTTTKIITYTKLILKTFLTFKK